MQRRTRNIPASNLRTFEPVYPRHRLHVLDLLRRVAHVGGLDDGLEALLRGRLVAPRLADEAVQPSK